MSERSQQLLSECSKQVLLHGLELQDITSKMLAEIDPEVRDERIDLVKGALSYSVLFNLRPYVPVSNSKRLQAVILPLAIHGYELRGHLMRTVVTDCSAVGQSISECFQLPRWYETKWSGCRFTTSVSEYPRDRYGKPVQRPVEDPHALPRFFRDFLDLDKEDILINPTSWSEN